MPRLLSADVMAMPIGLLVSGSLMLPALRLTKLDTSVPTAPLGIAASSVWVIASTGVASSIGASLVPLMVTVSVLVELPPRPSLMV